jgi:hypothetical protein
MQRSRRVYLTFLVFVLMALLFLSQPVLSAAKIFNPSTFFPLVRVYFAQDYFREWDGVFLSEAKRIGRLDALSRVQFYASLIIYGEKIENDGQNAMIVDEAIGGDRVELRKYLVGLANSDGRVGISKEQMKRLSLWIENLQ